MYDAISTLAYVVGGKLNQAKYLEIMMPPLIAKWKQHSNFDRDLFLLFDSNCTFPLIIAKRLKPYVSHPCRNITR